MLLEGSYIRKAHPHPPRPPLLTPTFPLQSQAAPDLLLSSFAPFPKLGGRQFEQFLCATSYMGIYICPSAIIAFLPFYLAL